MRQLRFIAWILLCAILVPGQILWLYLLRGARILDHDAILIDGQLLLGACCVLMALLLRTTPSDAIRLSRRTSATLIIGAALILHIASIVLLWPALSEDLVRYRLDARMWLAGVSPYATPPNSFHGDEIDAMATFPSMCTIYPPVAEVTFTISDAIERALFPLPGNPEVTAKRWVEGLGRGVSDSPIRPALVRSSIQPLSPALSPAYRGEGVEAYRGIAFRAIFAAFAVAASVVLMALLRGQSVWWSAIFAWHPLVILESGGMGHVDFVGIFLLLLALLFAQRSKYARAATCIILAAAVKPVAIVLLPFVLRDSVERTGAKAATRALSIALITLGIVYVAPLLYQQGYRGWSATIHEYGNRWEANGSIYEAIKAAFGHGDFGHNMDRAKVAARALMAIATFVAFVALWRKRANLATAGYTLVLVGLLFSPIVYPWYLAWALCFAPILRGGRTILAWAATAGISYALWHQPTWKLPATLALCEYLPVYVVLAIEIYRTRAKTVFSLHARGAIK